MKKNNKGLSLIELIVVIAIMGLLLSVLGVSIAWISRQKVINAAKDTKEVIQLARTYARSKGSCKVTIKGKSDDNPAETGQTFIYIYTASKTSDLADPSKCRYGDGPTKIDSKRITTKVYYDNGLIITVDDPSDYCDICFNRTLGGYIDSQFHGTDQNGVTWNYHGVPTKIEFTNGEKISTIVLAKYTGTATIQ